jgi:signal transduction histidine kinase
MKFSDLPLKDKVVRIILLTTSAVLLLTSAFYFAYQVISFRQNSARQLAILGKVISSNSTAALAFRDKEGAQEVLSALAAEPHIVAACLYDETGEVFIHFPQNEPTKIFPKAAEEGSYFFEDGYLVGFEPVQQANRRLGTLYLRSDMGSMYEGLELYSLVALFVITCSLLFAYLLSRRMQKQITIPLLSLAQTAKSISADQDYSVRARKLGNDEIGFLTDAFNAMLERIQRQTREITAFNQNLEEIIKERTRELRAANKELEAFSYSVSHDLRAPLRSIHGYMNIFLEEYSHLLDDEGKRLVNTSIANGKRMGQLIDDLLAFSRLSRQALRKSGVSMYDMVQDVWREQSQTDTDGEFAFTLTQLPPARADAVTIKQVWANLISNARKYSQDKPDAAISVGSMEKDGNIIYYVRDNGAGFDMQYYDKLFGVFQRLHSQEEFEGTGVGLAIVHRIIAKHGGEVWAEGEVDKGATFYFSLPRDQ